ncbi:hypothetical protein GGR57DRAFT_498737 [Xylariaceae sp. FL1272]|nr:hypothetical protein GGR57DRAFT_498737 [Xylariaceae sp. FL1272]
MAQCLSGYNVCPETGLPSTFCCESDSICVVLAGNTTVVCCPTGSTCAEIEPIVCNITLQDPTTFPEAAIKTTALNSTLPVCGDACCPFGYNCDADAGNCVKNTDQSEKPAAGSSGSTSSIISSSSTSTGTTSSSIIPATSITTTTPTSSNSPNDPTPSPNAGLTSGAKAGIALATVFGAILVLSVIFLGYRLHRITRQERQRGLRDDEKIARAPMRASDLWRRLVAVDLPAIERRCEVQGPEIVRLSGLHELDGEPISKGVRR